MTRKPVVAFLALILPALLAAADRPWSVDEVTRVAGRRAKVVVTGRIERAINFDTFIFADDTGRLLLTAAGVRQRLAAGDQVTVWGRFLGKASRVDPSLAELEAVEIALAGSPAAEKILSSRLPDVAAPPVGPEPVKASGPVPTSQSESASPSIEARLKALNDLKAKGLVTDDEYRVQRKRVLDDL